MPASDRRIRYIEHKPECFTVPPGTTDDYAQGEITSFPGRSHEAKRRLYAAIVDGVGAADSKTPLFVWPKIVGDHRRRATRSLRCRRACRSTCDWRTHVVQDRLMAAARRPLRSTFFGTSSIHLTDGRSSVFIDAFLTRPSLLKVALGRIAPEPARIAQTLARGAVSSLDAVFVAHSHHDHAMDAPEVVRQLGGTLYGSESTLNIGRGAGLPEDQMHRMDDGDDHAVGDFRVRVIQGLHSPGNRYPGTIDRPLTTPARASDYRDGGCYSFHVIHPAGSIFIHPSANFIPHKLDEIRTDVLYLGIGALGAQTQQFREDYWHHVVDAVRPSLILPVHWDDFGRPLSRELRPLPAFMGRFATSHAFLQRKTRENGQRLRYQRALETLAPFAS